MSATDILENQLRDMRVELASANRALGYAWARVHDAKAVADQLSGGQDVIRELDKVLAVIQRGDIGQSREVTL